MMTMFVMTLGEMNYHENFLPWDRLAFSTLTNILFIVLVLGMPIIMMNMLVRKRTVQTCRILIKGSINFFNASFSFKQRLPFEYQNNIYFCGVSHLSKLKLKNKKCKQNQSPKVAIAVPFSSPTALKETDWETATCIFHITLRR